MPAKSPSDWEALMLKKVKGFSLSGCVLSLPKGAPTLHNKQVLLINRRTCNSLRISDSVALLFDITSWRLLDDQGWKCLSDRLTNLIHEVFPNTSPLRAVAITKLSKLKGEVQLSKIDTYDLAALFVGVADNFSGHYLINTSEAHSRWVEELAVFENEVIAEQARIAALPAPQPVFNRSAIARGSTLAAYGEDPIIMEVINPVDWHQREEANHAFKDFWSSIFDSELYETYAINYFKGKEQEIPKEFKEMITEAKNRQKALKEKAAETEKAVKRLREEEGDSVHAYNNSNNNNRGRGFRR